METAELEQTSLGVSERLRMLRESAADMAGRIANRVIHGRSGRALAAAGFLLPTTGAMLAGSELPADAATGMSVKSGSVDISVTTECDVNTPNVTTVAVYSKGYDSVKATLDVGGKAVDLLLNGGQFQRHNFATINNDMPISLATTNPNTASNSMVNDCRRRLDAPLPSGGYTLVSQAGRVTPFGLAPALGGVDGFGFSVNIVDIEATPSGNGYYLTYPNGILSAFNAPEFRLPAASPDETVVSTSVTKTGNGVWQFTDKGDVRTAGDAVNYGSMKGAPLNGPILDSKVTPSGNGYWSIASDGGVFSFGDARFAGSMGGKNLNAPVVGMAPDPDGDGYWLVASDGGIFAFNAPFRGSMGGKPLNKPVIGAVAYGNGYLMIASDGGVFNFSDKPFNGSLGNAPSPSPIVDVAPQP